MEYLSQFFILFTVTLIGEALYLLCGLPVPGSVWGMILLFLLLCSGFLKLGRVEKAADLLIGAMPLMFVPVAVGMMESFAQIGSNILQLAFIMAASSVAVFAAAGHTVQFVRGRGKIKKSTSAEDNAGGAT